MLSGESDDFDPPKHFRRKQMFFLAGAFLPEMVSVDPGSMIPLLGRTQYLRGAVVFTLKHTFLSEGFFSFRLAVTTSVKGPEKKRRTS